MSITRESIVEASVEILNRNGADGFSLRAVAKELNVTPPTLYWHIEGKAGLYELVADHVLSRIHMSAGTDTPKKYLYEFCSKYRSVLLTLRDAEKIALKCGANAPLGRERLNEIYICLSCVGVKEENLVNAANILFNYILTFVANETLYRSAEGCPPSAAGNADCARPYTNPIFYYDAQFLYGLDVLFAGFKAISPLN